MYVSNSVLPISQKFPSPGIWQTPKGAVQRNAQAERRPVGWVWMRVNFVTLQENSNRPLELGCPRKLGSKVRK